MSLLAILTFVVYGICFVLQGALIVAAFQTSGKMGFLTLLVPMYAASFGNYRLKTERRRELAVAWWVAMSLLVVMFASAER